MKSYQEILFEKAVGIKAKTIVELGVGEGYSTLALLKATIENNGHLTSVDIGPSLPGHERVAKSGLNQSYWTFILRNDLDFVDEWRGQIDLLFIDTSHTRIQTFKELMVYTPLMAPNGIILLHDTLPQKEETDVQGAIGDFIKIHPEWRFEELLPEDKGGCGLGLLKRERL